MSEDNKLSQQLRFEPNLETKTFKVTTDYIFGKDITETHSIDFSNKDVALRSLRFCWSNAQKLDKRLSLIDPSYGKTSVTKGWLESFLKDFEQGYFSSDLKHHRC